MHLVHVHDVDFAFAVPALMATPPLVTTDQLVRHYRSRLKKLALDNQLPGSAAEWHVRSGRAYREICAVAQDIRADLIVLATHGRTGLKRMMLGSTAEKVIQYAPCPVVVVRENERDFSKLPSERSKGAAGLGVKKIVVPVDFSAAAGEGLRYAIWFAKQYRARLIVVHTIQVQPFLPPDGLSRTHVPSPGVIERAARMRARQFLKTIDSQKVDYEMTIQIGPPAHEICRFADEIGADLIITSTHGQTALAHALMGSVAEHVVRYAHCPVLVIPTRKRIEFLNKG